jgi:hypothetical protein
MRLQAGELASGGCASPKFHLACFEPKIARLQNRTASDRPADARSNTSLGQVSTIGFHCQPAGRAREFSGPTTDLHDDAKLREVYL